MPNQFPSLEIPLPEHGIAYTLPASEVFGGKGWMGLHASAINLLGQLQSRSNQQVIAWFCPLATMQEDGHLEHLVGLVFTFASDEIPPDATEVVSAPSGGLQWQPAGPQPPPDMAFPAMIAQDGIIYRAWLDDPEHQICLYLAQDAANDEVQNIGVETMEELGAIEPTNLPGLRIGFAMPDDPLMPTLSHLGSEPLTPDVLDLERMKIAFSWQFVFMVMNADGHVDEKERAFMARLFPNSLLSKVDLVDEQGEFREPAFTIARTEALRVLPDRLSMPERVELLRTLKQAAWADGVLVPEETQVYEAAADMLGVPLEAATQL